MKCVVYMLAYTLTCFTQEEPMAPTRMYRPSMALILRGSLIALTRKCGTPGCRCTRGELHTTPALSYSVAGVTKMLTLRAEDLPRVRAALTRYQQTQAALERHVLRSVETLRRERRREKPTAQRGR